MSCVFRSKPHDSHARTCNVRNLCSSGRVHMEVQPWVRASIANLEDLKQDVHVAPLKGANTICTNECRPGQTLEMEREQLSRSSLHNNIIVRWPSYFVGEGLRLLYCGAFDEGELPYDFRNRQGTVPLPPLQSCQHQGEKDCIAQYLEARHQARQTFNRYVLV